MYFMVGVVSSSGMEVASWFQGSDTAHSQAGQALDLEPPLLDLLGDLEGGFA